MTARLFESVYGFDFRLIYDRWSINSAPFREHIKHALGRSSLAVRSRWPGEQIALVVRRLIGSSVREDCFGRLGNKYGCPRTGVRFPEATKDGGRVKKTQRTPESWAKKPL